MPENKGSIIAAILRAANHGWSLLEISLYVSKPASLVGEYIGELIEKGELSDFPVKK